MRLLLSFILCILSVSITNAISNIKVFQESSITFQGDSTKPLIHYTIPDSTKKFVQEFLHPATRDSIYYGQRDIVDIFIGHVLKKAPAKKKPKHKLYFSIFPSTDVRTGNALVTATNAAFYLGRSKDTKLSSFTFTPVYTLHDQFVVPVRSNIWTQANGLNLVGDWRFMKYPQYSYFLGSNTKEDNRNLINYKYVRFYQDVLRQVGKETFIGMGYRLDYHYDITNKPQSPGVDNEFKRYGSGTSGTSISSGVTFNVLYDNRPNSINPDVGWYANAILRLNWKALGSNYNTQSLYLDARKYIRLSRRFDNILAFWGLGWFALSNNTPYLDLPSLGWDTYSATGRAYTQGRYRGKNMVYFETEYRFGIMRNGLLGGVVFANMSSYTEPSTNTFQQVVPAIGTGLRIKINKVSDTNFTFDYAHGINGNWGIWIAIGEYF